MIQAPHTLMKHERSADPISASGERPISSQESTGEPEPPPSILANHHQWKPFQGINACCSRHLKTRHNLSHNSEPLTGRKHCHSTAQPEDKHRALHHTVNQRLQTQSVEMNGSCRATNSSAGSTCRETRWAIPATQTPAPLFEQGPIHQCTTGTDPLNQNDRWKQPGTKQPSTPQPGMTMLAPEAFYNLSQGHQS